MTIDIKKFQTNFDFIKNKFYNKKIILFGAGIVAEKTLNYFDKKKIDYILDNSKNLNSNISFYDIINKTPPKAVSTTC
jgi:hypothetical protein